MNFCILFHLLAAARTLFALTYIFMQTCDDCQPQAVMKFLRERKYRKRERESEEKV